MKVSRTLTFLVLALVSLSGARADEVRLNNGDRLTGTIVSKQGDTLSLKTDYAGVIKIKWSLVAGLRTDSDVRLVLTDDTRLNGALDVPEPGAVQVQAGEIIQTQPFPLTQVAYINPPPEVIGEGLKVKGKANVGIDVAKGNTDTERLHFDSEVIVRSIRNRYTAGAIFNRATDNGEETEDNATAYAKYDHFLQKKWYLYVNTLFARDDMKDLNLRSTLGAGSGYQFFESDELNLALEGGLTYIREDYETGEDDDYPSLRWSINYDQLLLGTDLQFFHFQEGFLGLESTDDVLLRTQTGLRIPVWENLMATAQFDFDWDNTPASGKQRDDSRYLLNLGYRW